MTRSRQTVIDENGCYTRARARAPVGGPTETFGGDAAALQRVDGPVVVLERVHQLQDGANAADGAVDGGGADELRGQVGVEGQLDLQSHVYHSCAGLEGALICILC